jgi:hypothetical protein
MFFYRQDAKVARKGLKNNSKNSREKPALYPIENCLATLNDNYVFLALLAPWR